MPSPIKVSIVAYLNSQVFLYGLTHHKIKSSLHISKDIPSECARKLLNNEADIGLVPAAVVPLLPNHHIIGDTCIGAKGKVDSVLLCSKTPLNKIKRIYLDFHSRTSVTLVQVLAMQYWKITPEFIQAPENYIELINDEDAGIIIGDRTFGLGGTFAYQFDLAEEWYKFTQKPFVFAVWVAKNELSKAIIAQFGEALHYGLEHKPNVIAEQQKLYGNALDVSHYLNEAIQYNFDDEKKEGLNLFYKYLEQL